MNGILLVIKPPGMTSFDVVAYLRKVFNERKIGHAGTLDPGAAGLLPVCVGKATKAIEKFSGFDKSYRAEMVLGAVTDTHDAEGRVVETGEVDSDTETIIETLKGFVGKYDQVPPMYSAIKVNGRKLYDLARQGIEVDRKPRRVEISGIDPVDIIHENNTIRVRFDVDCSKGTYVRTLCHDIGRKLGCGAYMSFLVRTRVGPFSLTDGVTLEEINRHKEEGTLSSVLKPVDIIYREHKAVEIGEKQLVRFLNGAFAELQDYDAVDINETVRVYSDAGDFLGLGSIRFSAGNKVLKAEKLFIPGK
ncbi:MAG: tRNA pseudouridine(55) synthase TruB [Clostridiaceae bacterium]|nr:tRNA pseudouridine(55) synthase TruB [Clostridiaceae bacterium]